jgi:hypothetical protein
MVAQQWLKACKSSHRKCNLRIEEQLWVPSRLIDIGSSQSDSNVLRILVTGNNLQNGPYITLSHRWADKSFPMLTQSSLSNMKEGFSESILPKTFRDTIFMARLFNIHYIWIDCLCIVQDSPKDFQAEAALMHQVYGNSYCNISATGALNNHDGLFFDRNPSLIYPSEVRLGWEDPSTCLYSIVNDELWENGISEAPVNKRAWVVQERLLAPCVLHFGKEQLFWECREFRACESFPLGIPQVLGGSYYSGFKQNDLDGFGTENVSERKIAVHDSWHGIIATYSRGELSYPQDKLTALAGIASRVKETLGGEYLAGLWTSFLEEDLLWVLSPPFREPLPRPEKYRAPSWSWASVEGGVRLINYNPAWQGPSCTILEASVTLSTENTFGPVISGFLRVQGALKRVTVADESPVLTDWEYYINRKRLRNFDAEFDDFRAPFKDYTYCIAIKAFNDDGWRVRRGLLLRPTGVGKGEYCRIGAFFLDIDHDVDVFDMSEGGTQAGYPCEYYDEVTKQHTFTIV